MHPSIRKQIWGEIFCFSLGLAAGFSACMAVATAQPAAPAPDPVLSDPRYLISSQMLSQMTLQIRDVQADNLDLRSRIGALSTALADKNKELAELQVKMKSLTTRPPPADAPAPAEEPSK